MVKVELAVYDLSRGMAIMLSQQILGQRIDGIWHTGIVVNGIEYYFGGGIQSSPFGFFTSQNQLNPVRVQDMGETMKTRHDIDCYLASIRSRFSAATYDLINNNCNHFANELCNFLTGHGIPDEIVNLPRIVFSTPGGQMLRPMIDSIQQSIQQQRGTIDPFGGQSSESSSSSTFESTLSTNLQQTITSSPQSPLLAPLDDKPLVSNDRSSISALGTKILNLVGVDGEKGTYLSVSEKEAINQLITLINSSNEIRRMEFSGESFDLLIKLVNNNPSAQLASLFFLRIMFLSEASMENHGLVEAVSSLITMLSVSNSSDSLSPSSKIMAVCAIANMLSVEKGWAIINDKLHALNTILDIAVSGLSSDKVEMRQMCSAIANNISLHLAISMYSEDESVKESSQAGLVQLLLAGIENLDGETDNVVRKRRLAVICRIFRALGVFAISLANDLDLQSTLASVKGKGVKFDELERSIISEIDYVLSS